MKKIISCRKKEFINRGLPGILLIISGFLGLKNQSNGVINDIGLNPTIIVFVIAIGIMLIGKIILDTFFEIEGEDELSELNMLKGKSDTLILFQFVLSIIFIIIIFKGTWNVDISIIFPFLLGGISLSNFLLFMLHERVGE